MGGFPEGSTRFDKNMGHTGTNMGYSTARRYRCETQSLLAPSGSIDALWKHYRKVHVSSSSIFIDPNSKHVVIKLGKGHRTG